MRRPLAIKSSPLRFASASSAALPAVQHLTTTNSKLARHEAAENFHNASASSSSRRSPAEIWRTFPQEKRTILSKLDKSSKQSWDEPILPLLEKLNACGNFCTLSSCSGRAFLWTTTAASPSEKTPPKKTRHDDWRFHVCHSFSDWQPRRYVDNMRETKMCDERDGIDGISRNSMVWARFEPFIMHVACRSLEAAFLLIERSRAAFPSSSLLAFRKRFVVQVPGEEFLEMPYTDMNAKNLMGGIEQSDFDAYVDSVVRSKFERNAERTEILAKALEDIHINCQLSIAESDVSLQGMTFDQLG